MRPLGVLTLLFVGRCSDAKRTSSSFDVELHERGNVSRKPNAGPSLADLPGAGDQTFALQCHATTVPQQFKTLKLGVYKPPGKNKEHFYVGCKNDNGMIVPPFHKASCNYDECAEPFWKTYSADTMHREKGGFCFVKPHCGGMLKPCKWDRKIKLDCRRGEWPKNISCPQAVQKQFKDLDVAVFPSETSFKHFSVKCKRPDGTINEETQQKVSCNVKDRPWCFVDNTCQDNYTLFEKRAIEINRHYTNNRHLIGFYKGFKPCTCNTSISLDCPTR